MKSYKNLSQTEPKLIYTTCITEKILKLSQKNEGRVTYCILLSYSKPDSLNNFLPMPPLCLGASSKCQISSLPGTFLICTDCCHSLNSLLMCLLTLKIMVRQQLVASWQLASIWRHAIKSKNMYTYNASFEAEISCFFSSCNQSCSYVFVNLEDT